MFYWLSIIEWPLCLTLFYRPSAKCEPSLCPKNEWLPQKRFPLKASFHIPSGANHLLRIVSWNLNEPMRFGGLFRHRNCELRIWRWMFRDLQPWQVGLKSSVQWHLLCAMHARNKAFHPRRNGQKSGNNGHQIIIMGNIITLDIIATIYQLYLNNLLNFQ